MTELLRIPIPLSAEVQDDDKVMGQGDPARTPGASQGTGDQRRAFSPLAPVLPPKPPYAYSPCFCPGARRPTPTWLVYQTPGISAPHPVHRYEADLFSGASLIGIRMVDCLAITEKRAG